MILTMASTSVLIVSAAGDVGIGIMVALILILSAFAGMLLLGMFARKVRQQVLSEVMSDWVE